MATYHNGQYLDDGADPQPEELEDEARDEEEDWDLVHTDNAVCPHCKEINRDSWEIDFGSNDSTETTCGSCGKDYIVTQFVQTTYSTVKL